MFLAAGWLLLALSALALSTLCALLLIAARTPWLGSLAASGDLFGCALVLHVSLAVVVWFLACATALWTIAAATTLSTPRYPSANRLAQAGFALIQAAQLGSQSVPFVPNLVVTLCCPSVKIAKMTNTKVIYHTIIPC